MTSVLCSVILQLMWRTQGRALQARTWSFAALAVTCLCGIALCAAWFPNHESYWIACNAAGLAAVAFALRGHYERSGRELPPDTLWPGAFAVLGLVAWFTIATPHEGFRTGLLPLSAALASFLSVAMVMRHPRPPEAAEWATAIALALFGATQLAAATAAFLQGAGGDTAFAALHRGINRLSLPVGLAGVAMFKFVLLSADQSARFRKIAVRDPLTGLLNRRGFGELAMRAYATARRSGQPLSVIMADIDQFKSINDQFGRATGEEALRHVASLFGRDRRSEDILARLSGEEFAIVLPGTDLAESMRIATELCQSIEHTALSFAGKTVLMTASFGVATISARDSCLTDIIVRADLALYRSKRGGRNRVDLDASQIVLIADRMQDRKLA